MRRGASLSYQLLRYAIALPVAFFVLRYSYTCCARYSTTWKTTNDSTMRPKHATMLSERKCSHATLAKSIGTPFCARMSIGSLTTNRCMMLHPHESRNASECLPSASDA